MASPQDVAGLAATVEVMASQDDVRRIATSLPGVTAAPDHFAFSVDAKGKDE